MKIFIDSSVLIAGALSKKGGSSVLLKLSELGFFESWISSYVLEECKRVIQLKVPEAKERFLQLVKDSKLKILKKTSPAIIKKAKKWIKDKKDVEIIAAAKSLKVDFLVTLDVHDFIHDSSVSKKSGLKILRPGDLLKIISYFGSV